MVEVIKVWNQQDSKLRDYRVNPNNTPPQDLLYLGVRIKTTDTKDAECGQDSRWGRVPGTAGEKAASQILKSKGRGRE